MVMWRDPVSKPQKINKQKGVSTRHFRKKKKKSLITVEKKNEMSIQLFNWINHGSQSYQCSVASELPWGIMSFGQGWSSQAVFPSAVFLETESYHTAQADLELTIEHRLISNSILLVVWGRRCCGRGSLLQITAPSLSICTCHILGSVLNGDQEKHTLKCTLRAIEDFSILERGLKK